MRKFKRKQRKQLAFLTMIIMVASIAAIMMLTPGFNIKKISVSGNSVVKDEDIIRASGIVEGVNIFGVSLRRAEDNVSSMGYVENVDVKRRLPSTIEIKVVEEVGVAYIKAEEGYVIIAADGRCIDITDGSGGTNKKEEGNVSTVPDLPIITGLKNVQYKEGEIITSENTIQMESLLSCLYEFAHQEYIFNMVEINMSNLNDIKFYYLTRDLCVSVGDASKIDYKMECFGPVLADLGVNPEGYIDLGHIDTDKVIYREPSEEKPK